MEQGKIMEAEVLTVRVGATQTGLTAPHPHNPQGKDKGKNKTHLI